MSGYYDKMTARHVGDNMVVTSALSYPGLRAVLFKGLYWGVEGVGSTASAEGLQKLFAGGRMARVTIYLCI